MQKAILTTTILTLSLLLISFLSYFSFTLSIVFFVGLLLGFVFITNKSLSAGLAIIFAELAFGGDGYIFLLPVKNISISLRIAIFVAFIIIWLIRKPKLALFKSKIKYPAIIFALFFFTSIIISLQKGISNSVIYADANGYLYWLLLLPIVDIVATKNFDFRKILRLILGTTLAISVLVSVLGFSFYFLQREHPDFNSIIASREISSTESPEFSQTILAYKDKYFQREELSFSKKIYRWGKDRGIFDVSYVGGNFFRVYGKSQIFNLVAILACISLLTKEFKTKTRKDKIFYFILIVLNLICLFFGFSRSLLIGLFVALVALAFIKIPKRKIKIVFATTILVICVIVLLSASYSSNDSVILSRIRSIIHPSEEYASSTRLNMLTPIISEIKSNPLLGNGFGSTFVFFSNAPENYGLVEKYMTEWGYLDIMYDMGSLGIIAYTIFIYTLFIGAKLVLKQNKEIFILSVCSMMALLIINITTPYLNHPLGISIIFIASISFIERKIAQNDEKQLA